MMRVEIDQVRHAAAEEWDNAHSGSPFATFFHARAWAELWSDISGGRRTPAARHLTFSDGATAVVPMVLSRRFLGAINVYESSVEGTYGGWISQCELHHGHARSLVSYLRTQSDLEWLMNPLDYGQRSLVSTTTGTRTWMFDLGEEEQSLEQRWRRHKATVLRKVRTAEKHGLHQRRIEASDLDEFYELYLDCQRRWGGGSSFYPIEAFRRLFSLDGSEYWGVFHPDGRMVCGNLMLSHNTHAVCWAAVARTADLGMRPYEYMYLNQILDYRKRGYRWYDLNPSGGHSGVDQFKQRLGADPVPCFQVRNQSPSHRLAERAMAGIRRRRAESVLKAAA